MDKPDLRFPSELDVEFEFTKEQLEFRRDLCGFLSSQLTPEMRNNHADQTEWGGWSVSFRREFKQKLGAKGYIGVGWPEEYGGGGKGMIFEAILAEEMEYHDAPGLEPSLIYVPHALIAFGTDRQKGQFLPRLRRGEISIFLGYSEPAAGSDLANLSAEAVPEGDVFVITGQKMYSSHAHVADYGLVAARTARSQSRHYGITLFLVDMTHPGVQIAHHRTMAGANHPAVYFDHVPVPKTMIVGELHQGWKVLMGAIDYERSTLSASGTADRVMDQILLYLQSPSGEDLGDDPAIVDRLVSLAVHIEAARLYAYSVAQSYDRGEKPPHQATVSLLLKRLAARCADTAALEFLGPLGQLTRSTDYAPLRGSVEHGYRDRTYFSFAAGGFDIARNVIALRGLGLPR